MTRNPFTSSVSVEWATPAATFAQLDREFGPFDLDPAATAENAKAPLFYTEADDGLAQPWKGRVWLNPPYGAAIPHWMARAREAAADGATVVCLVPARVDTRWWRETAAAASLVRFFPQRLRFGDGTDSAPFPSALIVLGPLAGRHGTEARRCAACRQWWFPARNDAKTCSAACRQALKRSQVTGRKRDRKRRKIVPVEASRPWLGRCTEPACPVRYRTGPDHPCADHGADQFALGRAAEELGIDLSGLQSTAPGEYETQAASSPSQW